MSEVIAEMPPPPPPPPAPQPQFDFAKPFTYVFEDPRWLTKVLIGGLFYLLAFFIVGGFFLMGYAARTIRNIIRGEERPLPEWEDVGGFFNDGIMLFGVGFIYMLPVIALMMSIVVPMILAGAFENEGVVQALSSGVAGCLACLLVPVWLAVLIFLPAAILFVAVEQRFGAAFEFKRLWDFIRGNVGNYLLAIVAMLVANFLARAGIVLLCVGILFTSFWAMLVMCHAFAQVYRLARR
jgi:hypothetical protein